MKFVPNSKILIKNPDLEDLGNLIKKRYVFTGESKDFCREILTYLSDFQGYYEMVGKAKEFDGIVLKKLKKENHDLALLHCLSIFFPDYYDLKGHYSKERCCIKGIGERKKESGILEKKSKSKYILYFPF